MTATSRRPPRLPTDNEIAQAREASRQLARLLPADEGAASAPALRLVTDDNQHEMIAIPPGALRLLVDMLTQLGQGRAVTVLPQNAELTTQEVADYLNVSRPYVVKLIEEEKLPARKVGTRRRVAFEDLLRFDEQQRARQRAALDELAHIDAELADKAKAGAEKTISKNGQSNFNILDVDRLDNNQGLERERIHAQLIEDAKRGLVDVEARHTVAADAAISQLQRRRASGALGKSAKKRG